MCNFVLVGMYEMCDLSPIVFVGKQNIFVTVYLCVLDNNILKYFTTNLSM